jgi:hypothetical protein
MMNNSSWLLTSLSWESTLWPVSAKLKVSSWPKGILTSKLGSTEYASNRCHNQQNYDCLETINNKIKFIEKNETIKRTKIEEKKRNS